MKQNISFPIGIPNLWFNWQQKQSPCPRLNDWLLNTGSLTERLQAQCRQFNVQLLGQSIMSVDSTEARRVSTYQQELMVREVILKGEQRPWVFARTLMQTDFEDEAMQQLQELGERPLGQVIFNDKRFLRQEFELITLDTDNPVTQALDLKTKHPLWGRRSVFSYQTLKLMVAEIFLPDSPAYAGIYTGNIDVK